jgi:hypothetical protein
MFPCLVDQFKRLIERVRDLVAVTALQSFLDPGRIHFHSEKHRAVHGRSQRLRAAHPAEPAGQDEFSIKRPTKMLACSCRESFECSLHDSLAAYVNPGTRRHLSVHRQAKTFETIELCIIVPLTHEI